MDLNSKLFPMFLHITIGALLIALSLDAIATNGLGSYLLRLFMAACCAGVYVAAWVAYRRFVQKGSNDA